MNEGELLIDHARRIMAGDSYAVDATGVELVEFGDVEVKCCLKSNAVHSNVRGVVMGGALFTLADFAAAVLVNYDCIVSDLPFEWVTSSSEVHFLSAAFAGFDLVAVAKYLKRGRKLRVVQTSIMGEGGHTIAVVTTSAMRVGV